MSRDGLLPKQFSIVSKKFKTPSFATVVTGFLVGIPALFIDDNLMTDLTSIGTLFAFVLVCSGVLVLPKIKKEKDKFQIPYINGKWIMPALAIIFIYLFKDRLLAGFSHLGNEGYEEVLFLIFIAVLIAAAILSFINNYSLIPILGALCCLYLMISIPPKSWMVFFGWMGVGLLIYFIYGNRKSKLRGIKN